MCVCVCVWGASPDIALSKFGTSMLLYKKALLDRANQVWYEMRGSCKLEEEHVAHTTLELIKLKATNTQVATELRKQH